ncbi:helix-turn-helix domain-containing protein [Verticiella sediminum]|uniref:Helix-turn-helix domain-containing protein n=2 Tax=Verticiella sediminum TaxID=1247510 RepID=A0A556A7Z6_9BURK|nr:helix-turn-helix domain-containing protein [Verticiella sediminum]
MRPVPTYALYGEAAPSSSVLTEQLHCESIPSRSRLHDWEIRPHRHEHFLQILYIRRGEGKAWTEDGVIPLRGPCAVLSPAGHGHGFQFAPDIEGWVVTAVQAGLQADLVAACERPLVLDWVAGSTEDAQVGALVDMLVGTFASSEPWRLASMRAAFTLLLARLLEVRAHAHRASHETRAQRHLRRFRVLLERDYRTRRDIEHYAGELGITPTQLNRLCREHLGCSALGTLHRRLLAEAERDLAYTSLSVKEVALTLGFADAAYFSRFFHRHTGRTPSGYRDEARRRFSAAGRGRPVG